MNQQVVIAAMLGFAVGNLPDDSVIWAGIKCAFSVAAFVLILRIARRTAHETAHGGENSE